MEERELISLGDDKIIYINGKQKNDCESISLSPDKKWYYVTFKNSSTEYKYRKDRIIIKDINPISQQGITVFDYFSAIASLKDLQGGKTLNNSAGFYRKRMDALSLSAEKTALEAYLNKECHIFRDAFPLVFPFGLNLSQISAVENTFSRQISMIEGPPGTGKTQTILNIIASAVVRNQRVAVVSPNNAATKNVHEKLVKAGYGFITAPLGKQEYREAFFKEVAVFSLDERLKPLSSDDYIHLCKRLNYAMEVLKQLFAKNNQQAVLRQKLREWRQEYKYFSDYYRPEGDSRDKLRRINILPFSTGHKMALIADIKLSPRGPLSLKNKMIFLAKYGIWRYENLNSIFLRQKVLLSMENEYYSDKIRDLEREIKDIDAFLLQNNLEKIKANIEQDSLTLFNHHLYERYQGMHDVIFSEDNFKTHFDSFSQRFPVILSTCDAITDCISDLAKFDYVIIDEASMASLVPAIFAFGVAKNIVIVGDEKQLKNIVLSKEKAASLCHEENERRLFNSPPGSHYDYFNHSIMSSLLSIYGNDISVLLKEHYRCHPMIINYCNKAFYHNELVIMSEAQSEGHQALVLLETSEGNHMKVDHDGKIFNQREIDSFLSPSFRESLGVAGEITSLGFVTPYRRQVEKADTLVVGDYSEAVVDTVHKFQGRECQTILFSTVLDEKASTRQYQFVDDSRLVNVAVSRAKSLFILNSSVNKFKVNNCSLANLIRYIEYYGEYSLRINSPVRSIFDLLMKDYAAILKEKELAFRFKHSTFSSENLMMDLIDTLLDEPDYQSLSCAPEYEIRKLVKDTSLLNPEENKYVDNGARLDFVFYYRSGNEPVAALEVDGHSYHCHPQQQIKDRRKDSIMEKLNVPLIRFSTTGSEEERRLRPFLDQILSQQA